MKMEDRSLLPKAMARTRSPWRRAWIWIVLALLLLAGGIAYYLYQPAGDAPQRLGRRGIDPTRPPPVAAAAAGTGDIQVYLQGPGTGAPLENVTLRSHGGGELIQV